MRAMPAAFLVITVAIVAFSARNTVRWARLFSSGIETSATVTERRSTSDDRYLSYEFVLSDGRSIQGSSFVSWKTYRTFEVGDELRVLYLPSDPSVHGIHVERFKELGRAGLAGVLLLAFVGLQVRRTKRARSAIVAE